MYVRRRWYAFCRRRKCGTCLIAVLTLMLVFWLMLADSQWHNPNSNKTFSDSTCAPIDFVYTWVNGSDPTFIATIQRYNKNYDLSHYDDKNELLYSLRSIERFAPWVRHVFIVTNGQIPHWLDLDYEKVTVIPHISLAPLPSVQLPTFSGAAIETFLHRIPRLSTRFVYMNDDIFLGEPIYPEDFYTQSDGVRIYQTPWLVPDYLHDAGNCGKHSDLHTTRFPEAKIHAHTKMQHNDFKALIRHRNSTLINQLRQIVDAYNNNLKQKQIQTNKANVTEYNNDLHYSNVWATKIIQNKKQMLSHLHDRYKDTEDVDFHSLINTNKLLNRHYGLKARHILSPVGFLLQRDILEALQEKFTDEMTSTAQQRFRTSKDLHLVFAYYNFLMEETRTKGIAEIFDNFDTDRSGTWSDSEARTFLVRIFPLPLDWSALHFFEEVINNCTLQFKPTPRNDVTNNYERYEDSNLPLISRELVVNCKPLSEALHEHFSSQPRYKYNIVPTWVHTNNFIRLSSNVTEVVESLDKLRHTPSKFNCINDNMAPVSNENHALIRHLLEDFYRSILPHRSKFELDVKYRNRFKFVWEYQRWRRRKRAVLCLAYSTGIIVSLILIRLIYVHKVKFARRYVQKL